MKRSTSPCNVYNGNQTQKLRKALKNNTYIGDIIIMKEQNKPFIWSTLRQKYVLKVPHKNKKYMKIMESHPKIRQWMTSDQNHHTSIEQVKGEETVFTASQSDEALFQKARAIPNIDFLFMGYDISKGNPTSSRGLDPGFKTASRIFEVSHSYRLSADGLLYTPLGVYGIRSLACSGDFSTATSQNAEEYIRNMNAKFGVSVEGGVSVLSGAFSADGEMQRKFKELSSEKKAILSRQAMCSIYRVDVDQISPPRLAPQMVNLINNLIEASRVEDWINVRMFRNKIQELFGTHYISSMTLGSKFGMEKIVDQLSNQGKEDASNAASVNAGISSTFVEVKAHASYASQTGNSFASSSESDDISTFSIGAPYPSNHGVDSAGSWARDTLESTTSSPQPIMYSLASVHNLIVNVARRVKSPFLKMTPTEIDNFPSLLGLSINSSEESLLCRNGSWHYGHLCLKLMQLVQKNISSGRLFVKPSPGSTVTPWEFCGFCSTLHVRFNAEYKAGWCRVEKSNDSCTVNKQLNEFNCGGNVVDVMYHSHHKNILPLECGILPRTSITNSSNVDFVWHSFVDNKYAGYFLLKLPRASLTAEFLCSQCRLMTPKLQDVLNYKETYVNFLSSSCGYIKKIFPWPLSTPLCGIDLRSPSVVLCMPGENDAEFVYGLCLGLTGSSKPTFYFD